MHEDRSVSGSVFARQPLVYSDRQKRTGLPNKDLQSFRAQQLAVADKAPLRWDHLTVCLRSQSAIRARVGTPGEHQQRGQRYNVAASGSRISTGTHDGPSQPHRLYR